MPGERCWSIKAGKISKNRNKQTSISDHAKSTKKNCIAHGRKEIRAVCVLTPCLFNIKFKVKLIQYGHIFFCFASENLFSALMSRKGAELSTETKELIITLSESVQNKAELSRMLNIPRTTLMSVLSKHRRTGTVETLKRSGRKRSFTNRDRNALKHLVKSNR